MTTETISIQKLTATNGMILTDGESYGKIIFLAEGRSKNDFYEITESEYAKLTKNEEIL